MLCPKYHVQMVNVLCYGGRLPGGKKDDLTRVKTVEVGLFYGCFSITNVAQQDRNEGRQFNCEFATKSNALSSINELFIFNML